MPNVDPDLSRVDRVLARLDGTHRSGTGWMARCPAHTDPEPSLSVGEGRDGRVLIKCFAGCATATVVAALGLDLLDLGPRRVRSGVITSGQALPRPLGTEKRFDLRGIDGSLVATHVRIESANAPKRFRWERSGHSGLGGTPVSAMPLYGIEQLAQSAADAPIVVAEGETAMEALRGLGLGFVALGTVTGASGLPDDVQLAPLAGRRVFLWPDNDLPGRAHMARIAQGLIRIGAASVRTDIWPEAPPKGDCADLVSEHDGDLEAASAHVTALLDPTAAARSSIATDEPSVTESGDVLLDEVARFLGRFVAFASGEQRDAVALWVAHAHALAAFDSTPRLAITSPEKASGKTRLLEVLDTIVPNALHTTNISVAALFRAIEQQQPTLLFDEADAVFGPRTGGNHEDLRAVLNSGHRRGASVLRCVGQRFDEVRAFPVFCATALAGIGDLPDTVRDRSIVIGMRRRAPGEAVGEFRRRRVQAEADLLRNRISSWSQANETALREAEPQMPVNVTDRAADVWEPLLAIADRADGDWPDRARRSAVELNRQRTDGDGSLGTRLLGDARSVFVARSSEIVLLTTEIVGALLAIDESPWGDLRGRPLDSRGLAARLRPYGIRSRNVRPSAGTQGKGYTLADFADAWARYLPPAAVPSVPPEESVPANPLQRNDWDAGTPGTDTGDKAVPDMVAAVLTVFPGSRVVESAHANGHTHAGSNAATALLPEGMKHAWCPSCNSRAVVLGAADDHLLCGRCAKPGSW